MDESKPVEGDQGVRRVGTVDPNGEYVESIDELEEGELYAMRKGKLEKIRRAMWTECGKSG